MQLLVSKRRWYWSCQVFAWTSFWLSQYFALLVLGKFRPGIDHVGAYLTAKAGAGLAISHLYRHLLLRYGGLNLPPRRQALVVVLGILGIALVPVGVEALQSGLQEGNWLPFTWTTFSFSVMASARYSTIWVLSYHFFAAGQRLAQLEVRELHAEATRRQTELDLLRSQINPHFLFNALNSVRALTLSDPCRARLAVTQLADLLRYTLNYEQRQLIPLSEELTAVQDYLALEQTRFGPERLRLDVAVPPELLSWPVPPAALLTLVENAVKHGISATPSGGVLRLVAAEAGAAAQCLSLEVSQPGHLALVSVARPEGQPGGLGLLNTRQRLRSLYGDAASLTLQEKPVGTVVARLGVPATPLV
jgi:sensor histidine kinase YesM